MALGDNAIQCKDKSIDDLKNDGMAYNLTKNRSKDLIAKTSMSGKYPDAIKCRNGVILYIQTVDDANSRVTYRTRNDYDEFMMAYKNGTLDDHKGYYQIYCMGKTLN